MAEAEMGAPSNGAVLTHMRHNECYCFAMHKLGKDNSPILLRLAGSIRPDARELDHLAPLVRFFGDELDEVEGRAWKYGAGEASKACFDSRIREARIDFVVELIDDLYGSGLHPISMRQPTCASRMADDVPGQRWRSVTKITEPVSALHYKSATSRALPWFESYADQAES
jgi:hypothetical protein